MTTVTHIPPTKTARQREADKTPYQRAMDVSYTINHALLCTMVDVGAIPLQHLANNWSEKLYHLGCGHEHDKKLPWYKAMWQLSKAELAADFLSVPITITFQRFLPGVMDAIGDVMEPVFTDIFRFGAKHAAKDWAKRHGIDERNPIVAEHARHIYQHEINHMPQAAIWTASAYVLNIAFQKWGGSRQSWKALAMGKGVSSAVGSAALVGFRGLAPSKAENWDQITSKYLFAPVDKGVSRFLGVSKEEYDVAVEKQKKADADWATRVKQAGAEAVRA